MQEVPALKASVLLASVHMNEVICHLNIFILRSWKGQSACTKRSPWEKGTSVRNSPSTIPENSACILSSFLRDPIYSVRTPLPIMVSHCVNIQVNTNKEN